MNPQTAISGLGLLGDARSEVVLRRLLTNDNDFVRSVSASSLSGLTCRKATIESLADRLEWDMCPRVRWAAALTLGNVAGPEGYAVLERYQKDDAKVEDIPDQPCVADGVRDAIFRLRERSVSCPTISPCVLTALPRL